MRMSGLAGAWLLLCSESVAAQSIETRAVPLASEIKAAGGTLPSLDKGPSAEGKEAFFRRGIQGQVLVGGVIELDGTIRDASILETSGSGELDAFAQDLIVRSRFTPAKDSHGTPVASRAKVPVYLWKDSLADGSLTKKSCADFVVDADWHARTFPDAKPSGMRIWLLTSGAMLVATRDWRSKRPTFEEVYARCKAKPQRRFLDAYTDR